MKRFVILMIIAILTVGLVSAQNANPQARSEYQREFVPERRHDQRPIFHHEGRRDQHPNANPQNRNNSRQQNSITVTGVLKLEKGFIAIQNDAPNAPNSGSAFYLVPMLNRYIGFINGLREDARVTIEGHQFRNVIHPVKLTIGDRSYDFPAFNPNHNFSNFQNKQRGNSGPNMDRHRPDNRGPNNKRKVN